MRRGLVAVGGSCGDAAGAGMIAGTILVFGTCGGRPGPRCAGARSDCSARIRPAAPDLPAGRPVPSAVPAVDRGELDRLGFPAAAGCPASELTLYHGDLLSLGKGEVWIRDDGEAR